MCIEFKNSDEEGAKPLKVSQVPQESIGVALASVHHSGTTTLNFKVSELFLVW